MNDETDSDELLADLENLENLPPAARAAPPSKPGDIDAVPLHLNEGELARLNSADHDQLPEVVLAILSSHAGDVERLRHYFVESDARYTLDDGSLRIESCSIDESGSGTAWCAFTQSFFAGCRDRNVEADPCECELDVTFDRENRTIVVSTMVPGFERDQEEF